MITQAVEPTEVSVRSVNPGAKVTAKRNLGRNVSFQPRNIDRVAPAPIPAPERLVPVPSSSSQSQPNVRVFQPKTFQPKRLPLLEAIDRDKQKRSSERSGGTTSSSNFIEPTIRSFTTTNLGVVAEPKPEHKATISSTVESEAKKEVVGEASESDWTLYYSDDGGYPYYYNHVTGESQWAGDEAYSSTEYYGEWTQEQQEEYERQQQQYEQQQYEQQQQQWDENPVTPPAINIYDSSSLEVSAVATAPPAPPELASDYHSPYGGYPAVPTSPTFQDVKNRQLLSDALDGSMISNDASRPEFDELDEDAAVSDENDDDSSGSSSSSGGSESDSESESDSDSDSESESEEEKSRDEVGDRKFAFFMKTPAGRAMLKQEKKAIKERKRKKMRAKVERNVDKVMTGAATAMASILPTGSIHGRQYIAPSLPPFISQVPEWVNNVIVPVAAEKKFSNEVLYQPRYIWLNLEKREFHWARNQEDFAGDTTGERQHRRTSKCINVMQHMTVCVRNKDSVMPSFSIMLTDLRNLPESVFTLSVLRHGVPASIDILVDDEETCNAYVHILNEMKNEFEMDL